jgi:multiple sugar transport system permease protein
MSQLLKKIVHRMAGKTLVQREERIAWLFTLPTFLYVIIIFFMPAGYTVLLSLFKWNINGLGSFNGLQSYTDLFADQLFLKSVGNTLTFAALSVPFTILAGLVAALAFQSRIGLPLRNFFKASYFLPLVVSLVAAAFVWKWMFNPSIGLLNNLLRSVGLPAQGWLDNPDQVLLSIAQIYVWARMGFAMVIFIAGLEGIPADYYDAAAIDGANRWQAFRHITFPLLNPQFVLIGILEVITALRAFDLPYIAASGGPINASRTIVLHIYDSAFQYMRMGTAAAAAIILFLIILAFTVIQRRLLSRQIDY